MSENSKPDINKVRSALTPHLRNRVAIGDDTPLISGGLIDSMSLVELIMDLEAAFQVRIPASEVQPDDFDSVRKIAAVIERFR